MFKIWFLSTLKKVCPLADEHVADSFDCVLLILELKEIDNIIEKFFPSQIL